MDDVYVRRYCIAWGRDRRQVEAYLYGGNEIIVEYAWDGHHDSYLAIVQCESETQGFGAQEQAARLASGNNGSHEPQTLADAEALIRERFGARLLDGPPITPPGNLTRPSALAERLAC